MRKFTLISPIETSNRELISKVHMCYLFACRGHDAYIGDKSNIYQLPKFINNAIYIDKGYHKNKSEKIYDSYLTGNTKIVSLDEENGVDYKSFSTLNYRFPEKVFKIFDLIFLWGEVQSDFLKGARKSFDRKKVFCYGHPKFELLKPKNNYLYKEEVLKYKDRYGRFILINTNFGFGNNMLGEGAVIEKYLSRIPNLLDIIKYHKIQVNNFIDLTIALSQLNKFNIIIRPHPEEGHAIYNTAFEKYSNIHVVFSGSVIPWIIAADVTVHHDCTTSLEAAMLGKSSISYTKDIDQKLTTDIPTRISYQYNNINEVVNNINNRIYRKSYIDKEILEKYFSFSKDSSKMILDKIINTLVVDDLPNKNMWFFKILSNIKDLIKFILPVKNKLFEQKISGLNKREINLILHKINTKHGTNVKVKRVNKYLFKFEGLSK
jgi:surface carbohydrate biosynthesis protein